VAHQCDCTEHLLKVIERKRGVIEKRRVRVSTDVDTVVELMVLEQDLAREHIRVGDVIGRSLQPTKLRGDTFAAGAALVS